MRHLLFVSAYLISQALIAAPEVPPAKEPEAPFTNKIELKGKLPEDFDWNSWFSEGDQSVSGEMVHAREAAALLERRMKELCDEYRAKMTKDGALEAVKLFNEMQEYWEKSASCQIDWVGSWWDEGSGARAEYPKAHFRVVLRRIKELRELKSECLYLNE